jgi:ABC-type polysaccharide/polyol phosphate export permease
MTETIISTIRRFEPITIFVEFMRNLYKDRHMVMTMAVRELKVRYIGSSFGLLWAVINPLTQVAIYGIIFGIFFRAQPNPAYGTHSYFLYLICGLIPWQFFSQAVNSSTGVILSNRNLIMKAAGFPSEVLPIISIISQIMSHLIALAVLLAILVIFKVGLSVYILTIPIYLLFLTIFTVGLSWIISSINVYMRDVQHIVGLIMTAWFFFTPIFYSTTIIPPKILPLIKLNPIYHVIDGYRYALLAGEFPPLGNFLYLAFISLLIFGLGGIVFRKLKPGFAEIL